MSNNFLEFILGKDRYEKEERFKRALLDIEEEHIEFFKSRPSNHIKEDHDRLHDHYMMIGDNYKLQFGFNNDTELPREKINKCLQSFNEIFKT